MVITVYLEDNNVEEIAEEFTLTRMSLDILCKTLAAPCVPANCNIILLACWCSRAGAGLYLAGKLGLNFT